MKDRRRTLSIIEGRYKAENINSTEYHHHHHHHHHQISVMKLGHLLTRSGLTYR